MFEELEKVLNYTFRDKKLLREALTHKSCGEGRRALKDNERLEFLGDSILGAVVAEYLYKLLDENEEGVLSKIKANLVSRHNLYFWAQDLNLSKFILLGQGEEHSGGRTRPSILSNAVESLLGALYLDGGFEETEKVVLKWLETQKIQPDDQDYKSTLQERLQKKGCAVPEYEVISTVGPEHNKIFTVRVSLLGKELGEGKGKNKKSAEQQAAKNALDFYKKK